MQSDIAVETIDTHTGGEPTRIVTDGIDGARIRGGDVGEPRDRFATRYDWLRELLICEPRGHDDVFGAVPTLPAAPGHTGVRMCGHGTMDAVTGATARGRCGTSPRPKRSSSTTRGTRSATLPLADGFYQEIFDRACERATARGRAR